MSFAAGTASLLGNIKALRMGYAGKKGPDPGDEIVHAPWTRRDIGDMLYIREELDWLLAEVKSGWITEKEHGWRIRNVISLGRALEEKERAFRIKFNPYHKPAGSPGGTGGQFDSAPGGGTGRAGAPKIPRNPDFRDVMHPHGSFPDPDDELEAILESGGARRGGGVTTGGFGEAYQSRIPQTIKQAPREAEYLEELRALPKGVVETSKGGQPLNPRLKDKFRAWIKNNRSLNPEGIEITNYSDARTIYTFKSPGKAPGSYRVYEKQLDESGETISLRVVTIDANGMRVHTKDKITGTVVEYDTVTGEIKKVWQEKNAWRLLNTF